MKETERIADQLERAFHGDAWSGPSVKDVLAGVTAEMAAQTPLGEVHSIWELVYHITAWLHIVRRRVGAENFVVTDEVNFPHVKDKSEESWTTSLALMAEAESELRKVILEIPESRLDEPAVSGVSDTVYLLLQGAVQHSLYHAGQIILLKRFWTTLLKPPST